jgi:hypothetical protein
MTCKKQVPTKTVESLGCVCVMEANKISFSDTVQKIKVAMGIIEELYQQDIYYDANEFEDDFPNDSYSSAIENFQNGIMDAIALLLKVEDNPEQLREFADIWEKVYDASTCDIFCDCESDPYDSEATDYKKTTEDLYNAVAEIRNIIRNTLAEN